MENEKSLQKLCVDNLLTMTNFGGYLLIEYAEDGLNENCYLRKDFSSKQEAVAAPEVIEVKSKTQVLKFKKKICKAVVPSHIYELPKDGIQQKNGEAPYIAFWTIIEP